MAPPRNAESALGSSLNEQLVVYARDYSQPIYGDYVPNTAETRASVAATLAPGEYEPIQIGVYAPSAGGSLRRVRIDVDLDTPKAVGVLYHHRHGEPWRAADQGRWYVAGDSDRTTMPRYVVPGAEIPVLEAGQSAGFWVTLHAPPDAAPGVRRGTVIVSVDGERVAETPIEARILPFRLPRPDAAFGLYYRPDRTPRFWDKRYQRMYAEDMAAHGFTTAQIEGFFAEFGRDEYLATGRVPLPPTAGQWIEPWTDHLEPDEYADGRVDPERLVTTQIEQFVDAGVAGPDQPIITVQGDYKCGNKEEVAEAFERFADRPGWPEVLLQTRDEPPPWRHGPDRIDDGAIRAMLEFKRVESVRTFTALSGPAAFAWGPLHDVWIVFAGQVTPELVREADRQGAEVWTYSERLRFTNFRASRFYVGLYTWALKLRGNTSYCYAHYVLQPPPGRGADDPVWVASSGRPSFDHVNGYVLPSEAGPIPGVGFEGLREGIDDYRYLRLLEAAVSERGVGETANEARAWLAGLRETVVGSAMTGVFGAGTKYLWELDWLEPCDAIAPDEYAAIRVKAQRFLKLLAAESPAFTGSGTRRARPTSGWEGERFESRSVEDCIRALEAGTVADKRSAAAALRFKATPEDGRRELLAALINALDTTETRFPAMLALRPIGADAAEAIPALGRQMTDPDPFVRCGALLTLTSIGAEAAPVIERAKADPFPMIVGLAEECLERLP